MWIQRYDPLGHWLYSTAVAALPVLVLLLLLASGKVSAWKAALIALLTAGGVAWTLFKMPARMIVASAAVGVAFAFLRIIWLIISAVFLYDVTVASGQFEVMKASVARLSSDRRLQAVLVAFCFGAFIEGAAGFGAPVAISAAFLVGLGFPRFEAARLCLIANTAPVAWGGLGVPILTLSNVTGLDVQTLSATSGRILPILSMIIPFWLVRTMTTWRETVEVSLPLAVIGGTFAFVQFLWSNYVGFELVDIVSSVASLAAGVAVTAYWRPKGTNGAGSDHQPGIASSVRGDRQSDPDRLSPRQIARAWMPFAILTVTVFIWGLPAIKAWGTPPFKDWVDARLSWKPALPWLQTIARGSAVTGREIPLPKDFEKSEVEIAPASSTGTAVFLAALTSGYVLGLSSSTMVRLIARAIWRMVPAIAAILCMLALGFVTKNSGMDAVLGLAFTRAGPVLYPIFGTLLGWLGVALTGSDTSSNVLFGNLQTITARKLNLNPYLLASANTTGGVMGKMIDAQSIVVAAAATGEGGREGELLRAVFWHSLLLALLVGAIVWVYAHRFPGVVAMPPAT